MLKSSTYNVVSDTTFDLVGILRDKNNQKKLQYTNGMK